MIGRGEPGAAVQVRSAAGLVIGAAVVALDGSYSADLDPAQRNGEQLSVTQADEAGNVSDPTLATAPDLTAPDAPDAAITPDGVSVIGSGEPGAQVQVRDAAGTVVGTADVAGDGSFTVPLTPPQANGGTLTVVQQDDAGNTSDAATLTAPDITAPDAPVAAISGDGTEVTGTGEVGAIVTVRAADGTVLGTATVEGDGTYTVTLVPPQANGQDLTVTQADAAGNVSDPTPLDAPDITAPPPPTDLEVAPDGLTVTGEGEVGATVRVRDASGTVIGTGTVLAGGGFTVAIAPAQTAGETLSVTQTDLAGNQSGPAGVIAPFDIDAFDNADTASIDLVAATTDVDFGDAAYVALVSLGLLDLDAQVLAVPTVNFTVEAGHSLDATFTYDAVLSVGALSGYAVVVQRFDGENWVAVEGSGSSSLLEVALLNGDITATDTFGPGQYRAFLTFEGAAGVGVLGSLSVTGTDTDFTDVSAVVTGPATGNVITDPGTGGEVDVVSPQTVVQSVTVGGVTIPVTVDGTVVAGEYGTLVIDRDGSYTYTPDADAAGIGQVDVFQYNLLDGSDGETETATLSITIDSPDVTGAPVAADDAGVATVEFENVVTVEPRTQEFAFNTGTAVVLNPQTGSGGDTFTVAEGGLATVTITAVRQSGLAVLPTYTLVVNDADGAEVARVDQVSVANLPLGIGSGASFVLPNLGEGTYTYTVSSTNLLGAGYGTTVYVGSTTTYPDEYVVSDTTAATGNLLENDTSGSPFVTVRVDDGSGSFVEVGETPYSVTGTYGTLTVGEGGDYTYTPSATLAYSETDLVDTFTYQVVQPDGQVATATLEITVDVPADGVFVPPLVDIGLTLDVDLDDVVQLDAIVAAEVRDESASVAIDAATLFTLFEGQGEVEDVLGRYLGEPAEEPAAPVPEAPAAEAGVDIAALPEPADPLAYLVVPEDPDRHNTAGHQAF